MTETLRIKCEEIKGLMVGKRPYSRDFRSELPMTPTRSAFCEGWDSAIEEQGQKTLRLNREKTAKVINDHNFIRGLSKKCQLMIADAVNLNLQELLEAE